MFLCLGVCFLDFRSFTLVRNNFLVNNKSIFVFFFSLAKQKLSQLKLFINEGFVEIYQPEKGPGVEPCSINHQPQGQTEKATCQLAWG